MRKFYVYMYMRERTTKHGNAGTPYYVGKGHGNRAFNRHHRVTTPTDKSRIILLSENMSEVDAHQAEVLLIALWGRLDIGTGCLANLTDGGEGQCGAIHTPERRLAYGAKMKGHTYNLGRKHSPESRERRAAAAIARGLKAPIMTLEQREAASAKLRGRKHTAEHIAKVVAKTKGLKRAPFSDEWRANLSNSKKGCKPNSGSFVKGQKAWNEGIKGSTPWNKGITWKHKVNR